MYTYILNIHTDIFIYIYICIYIIIWYVHSIWIDKSSKSGHISEVSRVATPSLWLLDHRPRKDPSRCLECGSLIIGDLIVWRRLMDYHSDGSMLSMLFADLKKIGVSCRSDLVVGVFLSLATFNRPSPWDWGICNGIGLGSCLRIVAEFLGTSCRKSLSFNNKLHGFHPHKIVDCKPRPSTGSWVASTGLWTATRFVAVCIYIYYHPSWLLSVPDGKNHSKADFEESNFSPEASITKCPSMGLKGVVFRFHDLQRGQKIKKTTGNQRCLPSYLCVYIHIITYIYRHIWLCMYVYVYKYMYIYMCV